MKKQKAPVAEVSSHRNPSIVGPGPKKFGMTAQVPTIVLPAPRLLRIADAAQYLSATNWFVEELVREKKIRSIIVGKRRVIDVDDLNSWIEKQKEAA
jgi:excisionase family DNA binding protein